MFHAHAQRTSENSLSVLSRLKFPGLCEMYVDE